MKPKKFYPRIVPITVTAALIWLAIGAVMLGLR